jgi:hypothetical protein
MAKSMFMSVTAINRELSKLSKQHLNDELSQQEHTKFQELQVLRRNMIKLPSNIITRKFK